jgi:hypothetical protein
VPRTGGTNVSNSGSRPWSVALAASALLLVLLAAPPSGPTGTVAASDTRPPTADEPVPANLRPSLQSAANDYPKAYLDGCNVQLTGKPSVGTCLYGDLTSSTTIALFGDSHALNWFPAVARIAQAHQWRLLNLTMSACSPADIAIYVPAWKRISTECINWRRQAVSRLIQTRPAIILVSGTRGFAVADSAGHVLTGVARTQAWQAGMQRTLARLTPAAGPVVVLGDTPISSVDPPTCLAQHPGSTLACATPVATAINQAWTDIERAAAAKANVAYVDPSLMVCPSSPCPAVIGRILVDRNQGHLTATFAATLWLKLEAALGLPAVAST